MTFTLKPSRPGELQPPQTRPAGRGLLRIYLGYAPGTGKTFAMLSAAGGFHEEGRDVMLGLIETHGCKATEALTQGLPVLPPKKVFECGGGEASELDLDAALERRPEVLLVDDLAHRNRGDGRHPKRWGDLVELLEAGIEVHTTLNVQHLESVAEVVTGFTGMAITEVVPDNVLEQAEEIVLIDVPPDELLQRFETGKIYRTEQARKAHGGFFQKTHLLALRELAMRKAAHHVDEDARDHLRQHSLAGPWPAGERLLVCVGPSPYSERLVRATKRLADGMSASWVALHVDTGRLSPAELERVDRHLQLAQRLGAEVITQTSHSVVDQVLETAAAKNVSKVVTGRTPHPPWPLQALLNPTLADAVLRGAKGVDVLVLASQSDDSSTPTEHPSAPPPKMRPKPYLVAAVLVALATGLGLPASEFLNPTIQVMLYLAAVVGTAYLHGGAPSSFASVLSVLCFNFFFVPPRFTLVVHDPSYWLTFFGLLFNGLLVGSLTASVKAQSRSAQLREADAISLLALSRGLARAESKETLVEVAQRHLSKAFGPSILVLAGAEEGLQPMTLSPQAGHSSEPRPPFGGREAAVADRCYRSVTVVGRETGTLPGSSYQWHPLRGPTQTLGVAGLSQPVALGARRREDLLEAILNQVSAALERRSLAEAAQEAKLLQASERLHTALLNSISHDLRIPLVSIQGALTSLQERPLQLDEGRRHALIDNALSETDRLNRLVGNLLQKTRLETGHLSLKVLPCDVEDLVSTTIASLGYRLQGRALTVQVPGDLPLVPMDFVLIAQVLTNLLENALAYSPAESPIEVKAQLEAEELRVEVRDRGVGLGALDPERLFERFERGGMESSSGLGLGLSICKGLVEAHRGRVWGRNREGGGSIFTFSLPLEFASVA